MCTATVAKAWKSKSNTLVISTHSQASTATSPCCSAINASSGFIATASNVCRNRCCLETHVAYSTVQCAIRQQRHLSENRPAGSPSFISSFTTWFETLNWTMPKSQRRRDEIISTLDGRRMSAHSLTIIGITSAPRSSVLQLGTIPLQAYYQHIAASFYQALKSSNKVVNPPFNCLLLLDD